MFYNSETDNKCKAGSVFDAEVLISRSPNQQQLCVSITELDMQYVEIARLGIILSTNIVWGCSREMYGRYDDKIRA